MWFMYCHLNQNKNIKKNHIIQNPNKISLINARADENNLLAPSCYNNEKKK